MTPAKTLVDQRPPRATRSAGERTGAMATLGSDPRLAFVAVIALAAGAALLSAWLTPRGPITTGKALASMVLALGVGILAGVALGNRWSVLLAPAVFVAVFELARVSASGPTVDGIQLGSLVGALTFVVGRGVHGLLCSCR